MNIQPLFDRVVVLALPIEERTESGLFLITGTQEKPIRGTIVAVGPGKKGEPMSVSVGQIAIYGPFSGHDIQLEGIKYTILKEDDILAIDN
jgi:chaperonin GroES